MVRGLLTVLMAWPAYHNPRQINAVHQYPLTPCKPLKPSTLLGNGHI
jgi:hypothetical protein